MFEPCGSSHTAGASFAFGLLLVSTDCGKRATPVGRPDVLGVGGCARLTPPISATSMNKIAARAAF